MKRRLSPVSCGKAAVLAELPPQARMVRVVRLAGDHGHIAGPLLRGGKWARSRHVRVVGARSLPGPDLRRPPRIRIGGTLPVLRRFDRLGTGRCWRIAVAAGGRCANRNLCSASARRSMRCAATSMSGSRSACRPQRWVDLYIGQPDRASARSPAWQSATPSASFASDSRAGCVRGYSTW
jgi:hypothetical protein